MMFIFTHSTKKLELYLAHLRDLQASPLSASANGTHARLAVLPNGGFQFVSLRWLNNQSDISLARKAKDLVEWINEDPFEMMAITARVMIDALSRSLARQAGRA